MYSLFFTQLMSFSPLTRGLINGTIGESGGLYANDLEDALEATKKVARKAGCKGIFEDLKKCAQRIATVPCPLCQQQLADLPYHLLTFRPLLLQVHAGQEPGRDRQRRLPRGLGPDRRRRVPHRAGT